MWENDKCQDSLLNQKNLMSELGLVKNVYNAGRTIFISGAIEDSSSTDVIVNLLSYQMQNPVEDITMMINSPGGEVYEMFSILDMMDAVANEIRTIVIGSAASAGAILAICGTPGKRFITKNSRLMLHSVSGGAIGTIHDIQIDVDEIKRLNETIIDLIVSKSKLSREEVVKLTKRDSYILPEEAIKMGLVDGIINKIK